MSNNVTYSMKYQSHHFNNLTSTKRLPSAKTKTGILSEGSKREAFDARKTLAGAQRPSIFSPAWFNMLSATLSSLAKSSPAWSMGGRRYTTGAASSGQGELTFSAAPVRYSEMLKIKKQRFGRSLEEFKTAHEQPIVQLHAEIRAQKIREQKKLQNREASKSSTLRRRAKKAKKAEISAMDTREFTLQEKLKDLLQEDDLTLAQFMTSGHPKVKEIVEQDDIFENIQMRFDAFDEEAAGSDSWFSVGNLNAAFEPSRFKQDPTERWLWEKHLPDSELTKIISSDVLSCGLPLREDIRSVSTGLDSLNTDDFEQQGHRLSPAPSTSTSPYSPLNVPPPVSLYRPS